MAAGPTMTAGADISAEGDTSGRSGVAFRIGRFSLGDLPLAAGGVLPDAVLVYATAGRLNRAADNAVLLPTYYTGSHASYAPIIGPGRAIDPARHFIVIPNLFGNGLSTSPSHWPAGPARAAWPLVGIADNVTAQHRLLYAHLGVRRIALAAGWSMGAMQALHWAAHHPDMVERVAAICGTASCWPLNRVFLEGVRAALTADPAFMGGAYRDPPCAGIRAFARVYCGWAYSAEFFRERLHRQLGHDTLDECLAAWEADHLAIDAMDLIAMLDSWAHAALAPDRLAAITARTLMMPADRDAYFTLDEARIEAAQIPGAELRPILSPYGHCAGAPGRFPAETAVIETALRDLLG